MLYYKHGESERNLFFVGTTHGLLRIDIFLVMHEQIPIEYAQKIYDGLFFVNALFFFHMIADEFCVVQESGYFGFVQMVPEIMAHVEEKVGSQSACAVHDIQEEFFLDLEKGYPEVIAYIVYGCKLQRQDCHKISLGNTAGCGADFYDCISAGTYTGEALVYIGGFFAHWQMCDIRINMEIVETFFGVSA